MVHVVVDEGPALLNEPYHHERHVLHQPVRHRATKCREHPGKASVHMVGLLLELGPK